MDETASRALSELAEQIGSGVGALDFQVHLEGGQILAAADFALSVQAQPDGTHVFSGTRESIGVRWTFTPWQGGYWVSPRPTIPF